MAIGFIFFAFSGGCFVVYLSALLLLTIKNNAQYKEQQNWSFKSERPKISVLIALRNEEKNLELLLNGLINQTYPADKFEVILINDHSTDGSELVFNQFKNERNLDHFKWLNLDNEIFGKKKAIAKGIEEAVGSYLLFTDADCQMSESWISDMLICQQNTQAAMVCGPVLLSYNSLIEKVQAIEFSSLIAVAASSIAIHKPTLCNAANFLVRAQDVKEAQVLRKDGNLASGDDVFLLHAMKPQGKTIAFCRIEGAEIETLPVKSFSDFKAQRIRWAGKWRSGFSGSNQGLAIGVWLFHLLFLSGLYLSALNFGSNAFLLIVGLKAVFETFFLKPFNHHKAYQKNIGEIWLMQIAYSLYVLYFGIIIFLSNKYQWKGRNYRY